MPQSLAHADVPTSPAATWHALPGDAVAAELGVDPTVGLTDDEAGRRRLAHGPNRLAEPERRPTWRRFADQFASPLVAVLASAGVLAGAVGDLKDAVVIAGVLVMNALLGFVQEGRAEHALAALEGMLALEVTARRDGRAVDVPADDLVQGDIVLLEAGDRVPADGRILTAAAASVDESMLTGESVPATKRPEAIGAQDPPLGDRTNELFMNTTLVRGRVEMVVTATGMATEVGRIAELLATDTDTGTPLERQLHVLGKRLIVIVLVAVAIVFGLALLRGTELGQAALEAVALGVAAIPEGLPAVVTVTLAVGVSQMARHRAIVRRLSSVETLGSTTVICTDKTGTLTRNEMTPVEVWHGGETHALSDGAFTSAVPGSLSAALRVAVHASDASLSSDGSHVGDPTEIAVLLAADAAGVDTSALQRTTERRGELPFDSATKLMATVPGDGRLIAVKGAPDVLLDRCRDVTSATGVRSLDDELRAEVDVVLQRSADGGRRVLAIASRRMAHPAPTDADAIADELHGLTLEALVAIVDPPREGVAGAVELCHRAGVGVKMITGDHPGTARAIARELGIEGEVVTGRDLDDLSDDELAERIPSIGVCARVSPEHKVRIVEALQTNGEVVAMTGDGVNDAAALRRADVGVAMGIAGTEVTKEAADIVLADDDFRTIVTAVERGRTIFENILTFVRFQLTTNLAAITTILAAGIMGLPSPFTPLQILFVNLIADGPPAMALGVDRPRRDVMGRRPRRAGSVILDARVLRSLFGTAALMAVATLAVLVVADEGSRTTMAFTTFVLLQLVNVLAVRGGPDGILGRHQLTNRWVWAALALVLAVQVAVVQVGALRTLFDTTALTAAEWATAAGAALSLALAREVITRLGRRSATTSAGRG